MATGTPFVSRVVIDSICYFDQTGCQHDVAFYSDNATYPIIRRMAASCISDLRGQYPGKVEGYNFHSNNLSAARVQVVSSQNSIEDDLYADILANFHRTVAQGAQNMRKGKDERSSK